MKNKIFVLFSLIHVLRAEEFALAVHSNVVMQKQRVKQNLSCVSEKVCEEFLTEKVDSWRLFIDGERQTNDPFVSLRGTAIFWQRNLIQVFDTPDSGYISNLLKAWKWIHDQKRQVIRFCRSKTGVSLPP